MAKLVWKYQWKTNGMGDDPLTCELYDSGKTIEALVSRLELGSMAADYGHPVIIVRPEGIGFLFNKHPDNWGLWVIAVEP